MLAVDETLKVVKKNEDRNGKNAQPMVIMLMNKLVVVRSSLKFIGQSMEGQLLIIHTHGLIVQYLARKC